MHIYIYTIVCIYVSICPQLYHLGGSVLPSCKSHHTRTHRHTHTNMGTNIVPTCFCFQYFSVACPAQRDWPGQIYVCLVSSQVQTQHTWTPSSECRALKQSLTNSNISLTQCLVLAWQLVWHLWVQGGGSQWYGASASSQSMLVTPPSYPSNHPARSHNGARDLFRWRMHRPVHASTRYSHPTKLYTHIYICIYLYICIYVLCIYIYTHIHI